MYRDILTDKWVLGGVGFLIVFAVGCYFWYQHDIADERKAAAEAQELLRQAEIAKKVADTDSKVEQAAGVATENSTLTAEKPINEVTAEVESAIKEATQQQSENAEAADVRVSPFGFGPYPKVPEGFPTNIRIPWLWNGVNYSDEAQMNLELAARVLIKLWNEGDTAFTGGRITADQKVYPHYTNAAYVRYAEHVLEDGSVHKTIVSVSGGPDLPEITQEMIASGVIPGVRLIDEEEGAIDAFEFLNLK